MQKNSAKSNFQSTFLIPNGIFYLTSKSVILSKKNVKNNVMILNCKCVMIELKSIFESLKKKDLLVYDCVHLSIYIKDSELGITVFRLYFKSTSS